MTRLALSHATVDLVRGTVNRSDREDALTTRELDLLRFLVAHPSRCVTRDELLSEVWGYADSVVSRACDNAVRRVREKIEADPAHPDHLLTVHGAGYRFELADHVPAPVAEPPARPVMALGPVRIDVVGRRVERPEGRIELTEPEAAMLQALIGAGGEPVDQAALSRATGGSVARKSVNHTIYRLRAKVELDPRRPRFIRTAWGSGYRLERGDAPSPAAEPLFGREELLAEVRQQSARARFVLLLGPAGVGKSRLARELAAEWSAPWVDLAPALDEHDAATTVARALGLHLGGSEPSARVARALDARPGGWIVLDALEGLPRAAELLDGWLTAAPGARFLGTSRRRLGARHEVVVDVPPLDPASAVALFVHRAGALSSTTRAQLAGAPDAVVVEIVERVDRIPLAIELAAARTAVLGIDGLRARLSVDLLAIPELADPRHRSLRSVIEASLDALPIEPRRALQQLAWFRGGAFVEDAEGLLGPDAVDLLQVLRDHSLVRVVPGGPGLRFATWQAVQEVLDDSDPDPSAAARAAAWLGRLGEAERFEALGTGQLEAEVRRAIAQVDDLIRAARAAIGLGEAEVGGRCAALAAWVLGGRGPFAAGIALVDEVLAHPVSAELHARLLLERGLLLYLAGRDADAEVSLVDAVGLARGADRPWLEQATLRALGNVYQRTGRRAEARPLFEQAVGAARRWGGDTGVLEWHQSRLAELDGAHDRQVDRLEAGIDRARASGDGLLAARLARELGRCLGPVAPRPSPRALVYHAEAYEGYARFGGLEADRVACAVALLDVAWALDDVAAMRRWTPIAREGLGRLDGPVVEVVSLFLEARLALREGRVEEAGRFVRQIDRIHLGSNPRAPMLAELDAVAARVELARGRTDAAIERSERAMGHFRAVGNPLAAALVLGDVGLGRLARGDVAEARQALDQALSEPGLIPTPRLHAEDALVARAEGRIDAAADALARARAEAARLGHSGDVSDEELLAAWVGQVPVLDGR